MQIQIQNVNKVKVCIATGKQKVSYYIIECVYFIVFCKLVCNNSFILACCPKWKRLQFLCVKRVCVREKCRGPEVAKGPSSCISKQEGAVTLNSLNGGFDSSLQSFLSTLPLLICSIQSHHYGNWVDVSPWLPNWCHAAMSTTDMKVVQQNCCPIIVLAMLWHYCLFLWHLVILFFFFFLIWKIALLKTANISSKACKSNSLRC